MLCAFVVEIRVVKRVEAWNKQDGEGPLGFFGRGKSITPTTQNAGDLRLSFVAKESV